MAAGGKAKGGAGDKIKDFQGGNDKQREHLNELVTALNDHAKQLAQWKEREKQVKLLEGMEVQNFFNWVNGVLVTQAMLARTDAINA